MRDAIALAGLLDNANVRAFLRMIRVGEGTPDEDGYRRHFGGRLFDSFADHPRVAITAGLGKNKYTSTAAGAYQFLSKTWDGLVKQYGFTSFEPRMQDIGALALIDGRRALDDVLAGRIEQAIAKCNREWASLPGSPYGQPVKTLAQALATYTAAGGSFAEPVVKDSLTTDPLVHLGPEPAATAWPFAPPITPIPTAKEPAMLPFVAAAIPALIQMAPQLIRIFGDSPQAEKNAKAAEVVAEIAKNATGETTVEGAVTSLQANPAAQAQFREEVHLSMGELMGYLVQAHELDEKSKAAATDRNLLLAKETGGRWLWLLGGVALIVVLMSYAITGGVLFWNGTTFSDETKALLLGQVVIFGFMTVLAFLFGSNIQNRISQNKPNAEEK